MATPAVNWGDLWLLLDPSCLALIGTATAVVLVSAVRALEYELTLARMGVSSEEASVTLDGQQAAMLPLVASVSLLVVFFFFSSIQFLMLIGVCLSSVAAIIFCLYPLVQWQQEGSGGWLQRSVALPGGITATLDTVLLGVLGAVLVLWWLITGSMLLNNVLGIAFCCAFISFVRLPNIRVCTVLLSGLFVYDIFWVFLSERFFGSNVMVAAATKQATNPVHLAAEALHLPVPRMVSRQLDLPMKLLFPRDWLHPEPQESLMLGLGDMALPGLLLALLLCGDYRRAAKRDLPGGAAGEGGLGVLLSPRFWRGGYTGICWAGYCAGLVMALASGVLFQAAQPALLYLVPCTLLPVMARAAARGEWGELWGGKRRMVAGGKWEEPEQGV